MIKLTTTGTHEYFAVPVPASATTIQVEKNLAQTKWFVYWGDKDKWDTIRLPFECPELLGVIGNGEEISEELAISVLYEDYPSYEYDGGNALKVLKTLLSEKGILVENPVQKPARDDNRKSHNKGDAPYFNQLERWQSYESKLVKAVIIKVKK